MFNFTSTNFPSLNAHIQSQLSLASDISRQMFDATQKVHELNLQVCQTLLEESVSTAQELYQSQDPIDALSIVSSQVQPTAEKVRAYQQHLIDIAANTEVNVIKAAESRIPEASRTAQDVAKEVARKAAEATEQVTQRQKSAMEKMTAPLASQQSSSRGSTAQSQKGSSAQH